MFHDSIPDPPLILGDFGVTIARQIDEQKASPYGKKIDFPGSSGGSADAGQVFSI